MTDELNAWGLIPVSLGVLSMSAFIWALANAKEIGGCG